MNFNKYIWTRGTHWAPKAVEQLHVDMLAAAILPKTNTPPSTFTLPLTPSSNRFSRVKIGAGVTSIRSSLADAEEAAGR